MKLNDVVNQAINILPQYTDRFSDVADVIDISVNSAQATITVGSNHNLQNGDSVTFANVEYHNIVDSVSQDGLNFTFTTSIPHDLTFDWSPHDTVNLDGFIDTLWNDSFELTGVPDRNTFVVKSSNTIPTLSGSEYLLENRIDGINGRYGVYVIDDTSFSISGSFLSGVYSGGSVDLGTRVAGVVNIERSLEEYTKQPIGNLWMLIQMSDVEASKDRQSFNDATAMKSNAVDFRMTFMDGFTCFIFVNTSNDITATEALDICRDELFSVIMKTFFGAEFDSGLPSSQSFATVLTGHRVEAYNRAYLVYSYEFEVPYRAFNEDTVEPENTRAFRDINYIQSVDTQDMTIVPIKLD